MLRNITQGFGLERTLWNDVNNGEWIKMELRDIGLRRGGDWIHLAQERDQWRALVNTVMNFRVPENAWNFLEWLSGCWLLKDLAPRSFCN
jgi:hypothetical protein